MLKKVNDKTVLTDTSYSISKSLVTLWIPAASSLYFGLSNLWDWPYTEQIVGTLALLATFLGVVLRVSTSNYNTAGGGYDGQVVVTTNDQGGTLYSLELNGDPADLKDKQSVSFQVQASNAALGDPSQ